MRVKAICCRTRTKPRTNDKKSQKNWRQSSANVLGSLSMCYTLSKSLTYSLIVLTYLIHSGLLFQVLYLGWSVLVSATQRQFARNLPIFGSKRLAMTLVPKGLLCRSIISVNKGHWVPCFIEDPLASIINTLRSQITTLASIVQTENFPMVQLFNCRVFLRMAIKPSLKSQFFLTHISYLYTYQCDQ